jgi:hypothetical protein
VIIAIYFQKKNIINLKRSSVSGGEKLITPVKGEGTAILYYLNAEEIFYVVHNTHLKIGHGGRTRMENELTRKYKNVTKEIIMTCLIYASNVKPRSRCLEKV